MGVVCTKAAPVPSCTSQVTRLKALKAKHRCITYRCVSVSSSDTVPSVIPSIDHSTASRTSSDPSISRLDPASQAMLDLLPYPALVFDAAASLVLGTNRPLLGLFGVTSLAELDQALGDHYVDEVHAFRASADAFRSGALHPRRLLVGEIRAEVLHTPFPLPSEARPGVLCSFFPDVEYVGTGAPAAAATEGLSPVQRKPSVGPAETVRQLHHNVNTPLAVCVGLGEMLRDAVVGDAEAERLSEDLADGLRSLEAQVALLLASQESCATLGCGVPQPFNLEDIVSQAAAEVPDPGRVHVQTDGAAAGPTVLGHTGSLRRALRTVLRVAATHVRTPPLHVRPEWDSPTRFRVRVSLPGLSAGEVRAILEGPAMSAARRALRTVSGDVVAAEGGAALLVTGAVDGPLPSQAAGCTLRDDTAAAAGAPRAAPRVLVVDDIALNRLILAAKCRRLGLPDVDCAVDGADALAHLAHHKYDLVLMDLQMPGMDGVEATLAIRGAASPVLLANRDVPIVAVTALHLAQERNRCLAAGFSRVCTKPLADDTLRSVVTDLLGGAPAARR